MRQITVGSPGPQQHAPNHGGTPGPHPQAPDRSGHSRLLRRSLEVQQFTLCLCDSLGGAHCFFLSWGLSSWSEGQDALRA